MSKKISNTSPQPYSAQHQQQIPAVRGKAAPVTRGHGYPESRPLYPNAPAYTPAYQYHHHPGSVVYQPTYYPEMLAYPPQPQHVQLRHGPPFTPQTGAAVTPTTPSPQPMSNITQASPSKHSTLKAEAAPFVPKTYRLPNTNPIDPNTNTALDITLSSSVNQSSTNPKFDAEKQKREEKQKEEQRLKEERERLERERLDKEREEKQRMENERLEKERHEKEEHERRVNEEREKAEKEERERQEKEKREQEERDRRQREENERREKEEREREEKRRQEEAKQQKEEAEEEDDDLDSDDDSRNYQNSEQDASKNSSEPQMTSSNGKKMYTRDFLLSFQNQCRDRPESLPMVEAIVGIGDDRQGNGVLGAGPRGANVSRQRSGGAGQRNSGYNNNGRSGGGKIPPNSKGPAPKRQPWGVSNDDPLQKLKRNVTSLLNKITVEKFDEISDQILKVGIDTAQILDEVIGLSFQKAISEPHFANLYADLCVKLSKQCVSFDDPENPTKKITFKRILLNRCQDEFEKKRKEGAAKETEEYKTEEEREEARFKQRRRMTGNIKFIGELYNRNLLPATVVANSIIPMLLHNDSDPDELECLCKFLKTSGKFLEASCNSVKQSGPGSPIGKFNEYFDMIRTFSQDLKYDSRIRFMLIDILELRQNNWVPRREEKTAKKIKEIHQDHQDEEISNASLPTNNQTVLYPTNFRRTNDRSRNTGSPASSNHYDKSRPSAPAKQSPQSTFKSPQSSVSLRPNGGQLQAWGRTDQKQNSNPNLATNKPAPTKPAAVTFDLPSPSSGPITLEAWEDLISPIFEELFVSFEISETAKDFKQQISNKKQSGTELQVHIVVTGCLRALDGGASSIPYLSQLFVELISIEVITAADLQEGLRKTRDQLGELKLDIPHAPVDFCQIVCTLFNSETLDFKFFQELYPLKSEDLDAREAFVHMILALNKLKEPATLPSPVSRLFESKLPITNFFPTADVLLSQLLKMKAFSVFGIIPWEKTYAKDVKSGAILTWFTGNQNDVEFETSDSAGKFMRLFLTRVTSDSNAPSKPAWGKPVDPLKKTEQEVIDSNSKLLSNLLSTTDSQVDAMEAIQAFSVDLVDKQGLLERILPIFFEKKIFGVESLTTWLETRGESMDAKLKQFLNSLKGDILSKAS